MNWAESASRNLIPLSVSDTLKDALKEWNYAGNIEEDDTANSICELCDHPNIRYKFQIVNKNNNSELYVGSECIHKFGILGLSEDGTEITQDETMQQIGKHKSKLIKERNIKHVLESLILLSKKDEDFEKSASDFYKYYENRGAFTPKQLNLLLFSMKKCGIKYNKKSFKMTIKRNREKEQLVTMKDFQIGTIWDCMSPSQKEYYLKHKEL